MLKQFRIKSSTFLFLFCGLGLGQVNASFLVEPILGYNIGNFESFTGEDQSAKGIGIGGRLGFEYLGLQGALDGSFSTLDIDDNIDDDGELREFGLFIGYDFPILFRVWAGYMFSANMERGNTDFRGSGTKVGVGFSPLPLLSLNLEYKMINFDELEFGGVTTSADRDLNTLFFSVSVPLNL